jgi:hypothetical protein
MAIAELLLASNLKRWTDEIVAILRVLITLQAAARGS